MNPDTPAHLRAPAIGFDLGETLWHYIRWPLGAVEAWKPVLTAVAEAASVGDRADIDGAAQVASDLESRNRGGLEEVNTQDAFGAMLHALGGDAGRHVETAVDTFFHFFRQDLELYPSAVETLAGLKRRGFKVGALTNVPYGMPRATIQADLERTGLAPHVDALVTSADVGLRKPHAATYEWLAAGLGVATNEIIYVGNAATDVQGALAVGATPVFVDRDQTGDDHGQAATITSLGELLDLVELAPQGAGSDPLATPPR
jgi:putative hydrolase of the HAD superfamily